MEYRWEIRVTSATYYSQLSKRSHLKLVSWVAKTCTNMSRLDGNTSHPVNNHYNSNPDTFWTNHILQSRTGYRWQYNTTYALYMLDKEGYKHTIRICNTYCLSTATVVTRTPLNVTVHLHACLVFFSEDVTRKERLSSKDCSPSTSIYEYRSLTPSLIPYITW